MEQAHAEAAEVVASQADESARRTERLNTLRADLRAEMVDALNGHRSHLKVVNFAVGGPPRVVSVPASLVVLDVIDLAAVMPGLMRALKNSDCPHVRALRTAIISRYVDTVAPHLDLAHGGAR